MTLISSISGVRGTIGGKPGDALTPFDILNFTGAYATWIKKDLGNPTIVVGRDARVSGEMVFKLISATLNSMGINVVDLGLATTPTVEMAVVMEKAQGGIIITASHNPENWNALKLLNAKGEFISQADGEELLAFIKNTDFTFSEISNLGSTKTDSGYLNKHIEAILALPLVDCDAIKMADFKIAVDSVNSVGSPSVRRLLNALGVSTISEIFSEPNGKFSRIAEPLEENLTELCETVKNNNSDLGIAVDPDVDRLAMIDENGKAFGEEYTLVAVSDYVLSHTPGNLVANLSSTNALKDIAQKHKAEFSESAVGEVNVVTEMKRVKAVIGGEGNGGVIYPELHYGRDALAGIALFLSHLAKSGKSASQLRRTYPDYFMLKDKMAFDEGTDLNMVLKQVKSAFANYRMNETDGLKIYLDNGWVHMRKSNTEPIVRIYIEAGSKEQAETIKKGILKTL